MPPLDPFPEVSELGPVEDQPAGTVLFRQGHRPTAVSLIVGDGLVKKVRAQPDGTQAIVALRRVGWLLGAGAVVMDCAYVGTASTVTRCQVRSMGRSAFLGLYGRHSAVTAWVGRMLARAEREHEIRHGDLASCFGKVRLIRTFTDLIEALRPPRRDGWIVLRLPFQLTGLAEVVAPSRQHLHDLIHELTLDGVLRAERGCYLLLESYWDHVDVGE